MIIRLLLLFLIAVFIAALLRLLWLRYRPGPRQMLLAAAISAGLIGLLGLVVTGRLHWIAAALGVGLPLAMRIFSGLGLLRLLQRLGGATGPTPFPGSGPSQRSSQVNSRFLEMAFDHDSGHLTGQIIDGPHAGASLADLSLAEQLQLLAHYRREDQDSARLLETFLDRSHGPVWREAEQEGSDPSREQALRILGLSGQPDRRTITAAHRRMMQKYHPDHGGSEDMAARINAAKQRLIKDLETS